MGPHSKVKSEGSRPSVLLGMSEQHGMKKHEEQEQGEMCRGHGAKSGEEGRDSRLCRTPW